MSSEDGTEFVDNALDATFTAGTRPGGPLQGAIVAGVDERGGRSFIKAYGRSTISLSGPALSASAIFKVASCTKLITTIAALQCVERGQIGLDDSVFGVLPELSSLEIVHSPDGGKTLTYAKPGTDITLRHLLTHSSGLAYDAISPLLASWRASRGEEIKSNPHSGTVPECFSTPLLFEPGESWVYGPGMDWAGYLVRRLNDNVSLERYFAENIFSVVGREPPFPVFNLTEHAELKERLMECGQRFADGMLSTVCAPFGENAKDEHGGSGLAMTTSDITSVLADLLRDDSKLLRQDTITAMFSPQFLPGSKQEKALQEMSMLYAFMLGGADSSVEGVNYGLGSMLLVKGSQALGAPPYTLLWGGFTNPMWQMNRDKGAGGVTMFQVLPTGDAAVVKLNAAFWRGFWTKIG